MSARWAGARGTRGTSWVKFSLMDRTRVAVSNRTQYRMAWFDAALVVPPIKLEPGLQKKSVPFRMPIGYNLIPKWIEKYTQLLHPVFPNDVSLVPFLSKHPILEIVAEQHKLMKAGVSEKDSFLAVEKKLKQDMSRKALARRIQSAQAIERGANHAMPRWKEALEWLEYTLGKEADKHTHSLLLTRVDHSYVHLSDVWKQMLDVIKMNAIHSTETGELPLISAEDLEAADLDPADAVEFCKYYPQYSKYFEVQLIDPRLAYASYFSEKDKKQIMKLLQQYNSERITNFEFDRRLNTILHTAEHADPEPEPRSRPTSQESDEFQDKNEHEDELVDEEGSEEKAKTLEDLFQEWELN